MAQSLIAAIHTQFGRNFASSLAYILTTAERSNTRSRSPRTSQRGREALRRTCGGSEKSGLKSGRERAPIIAGVWPQTTVFRFKTIFGDRLQTRQIDNQFKELMLKSASLNRMTHLGMPDSVKVAG
jgi:hypothetical protein